MVQLRLSNHSTEVLVQLCSAALCFLTTAAMLVRIRWMARQAMRGDLQAATCLILPVYRYIIVAMAFTVFVDGVVIAIFANADFDSSTKQAVDTVSIFVLGFDLALRRFVVDGLALFLMQHGAGRPAVIRTLKILTPWTVFSFATSSLFWDTFIKLEEHEDDGKSPHLLMPTMATQVLVLSRWIIIFAFYLALLVVPPSKLYRRPAMGKTYPIWQLTNTLITAVLWSLPLSTEAVNDLDDASICVAVMSAAVVVISNVAGAFVVFRTVQSDSEYWQGLFDWRRTVFSLGERPRTITEPLLGHSLRQDAAQELATTLDVLSSNECRFIHFGLLNLQTRAQGGSMMFDIIGAGGASKVYKGTLSGEPVAIKMIWSVDITVETIQLFEHEVTTLTQLGKHPNIVQIHGFSVMPPALCLVMELCDRGSLLDVLAAHRQGTEMLPWIVRLKLSTECAEALTFLHEQHPMILHKDIKSANFLVVERPASPDEHMAGFAPRSGVQRETGGGRTQSFVPTTLSVRLSDLGSAVEDMLERMSAASMSEPTPDPIAIEAAVEAVVESGQPSLAESGSGCGQAELLCSSARTSTGGRSTSYESRGAGGSWLVNSGSKVSSSSQAQDGSGISKASSAVSHAARSTDVSRSSRPSSISAPQQWNSFSVAGSHSDSSVFRFSSRQNRDVTPNWAAPEVLCPTRVKTAGGRGRDPEGSLSAGFSGSGYSLRAPGPNVNYYTSACDIYSLGVVLWELLTCDVPFPNMTFNEITIAVGQRHKTPPIPPKSHAGYADLLRECWATKPGNRPPAIAVRDTLKRLYDEENSELRRASLGSLPGGWGPSGMRSTSHDSR